MSVKTISIKMSFSRFIGLFLVPLALSLSPASAQVTEALELSTPNDTLTISSSKQFRVFSKDRAIRNTFASFAERQKDQLLNLLSVDDTWHAKIILRVSGKLTDPPVPKPVRWRVNLSKEQGYKELEIRVRLGSSFSREEMNAPLLHVLMYEIALRDIEVKVTQTLIPRWVRIGLPRALELRRTGRQSSFFRTMFRLNLVTPAAEILSAEDEGTDSVARTVYEASAAGFVLMLIDQKDGALSFGKLLHAYGGAHGKKGHNLLARFYPSLIGTADRLEQTWILYCAKLSEPQATEFLTPVDTEERLVDAIKVKFLEFVPEASESEEVAPKKGRFLGGLFKAKSDFEGDAEKVKSVPSEKEATRLFEGTLFDYERFLAREDRAEILAPVQRRLLELDIRSFPLHRPLIKGYHHIVVDLMSGKPDKATQRLTELQKERESLAALMANVDAYIDAAEADRKRGLSGVFDNFMEGSKAIRNQKMPASDPISRYLDEAEEALK